MKRIIFLISILLLTGSVSAQEPLVEIILGPRDGDNAGTIYADTDETIDVEVWFRTAPGISIDGFHLPLSSKDDCIATRNGVDWDYYPLNTWMSIAILPPTQDVNHEEYTNQGFLAVCCIRPGDYEDGIHTEGEWWLIFTFSMTTVAEAEFGITYCDAFIEGTDPINGGPALSGWPGYEMDPLTYTIEYPCLQFGPRPCDEYYVVGDFNGNWQFNVADIIASFSYLATGSPEAGLICECPPGSGHDWAVAMDVNNSCAFNVADVIAGFSRLQTGSPELAPCEQCPPEGR